MTTTSTRVVDEAAKVQRFMIRRDKLYLSTPSGQQDLDFKSSSPMDALKFGTVGDAETMIAQMFDTPDPTRWDGRANVPDENAPVHVGSFYGQDKAGVVIVATHT